MFKGMFAVEFLIIMRRRSDRWIQKAIKKPGSLRAWLKRNRARIKRVTGKDPFTKSGKVNVTALKRLRRSRMYERLPARVKQKINLAITLHKLRSD
jgi:hypothetical protein